jgi:hypothetical protein
VDQTRNVATRRTFQPGHALADVAAADDQDISNDGSHHISQSTIQVAAKSVVTPAEAGVQIFND